MNAPTNLMLSEQFRLAAKDWVQKDSAANLLEESKSAVLARMVSAQGDMAVNRAELNVKSSEEWQDYITKMVDARSAAAMAKVRCEYLRMKFSEWQSAEASKRAEMRL
jgi:hypothetical protein